MTYLVWDFSGKSSNKVKITYDLYFIFILEIEIEMNKTVPSDSEPQSPLVVPEEILCETTLF
jgi:hypothetical protein